MKKLSYSNEKQFIHINELSPRIKLGIVGREHNPVNYSLRNTDQNANFILRKQEQIHLASLFPDKKVITLNQTHSDDIFVIDDKVYLCSEIKITEVWGEGDAVISNHPDYLLSIITADCYPIFIADEKKKVLAAIHAGWRGTEKKIVQRTIQAMQLHFKSDTKDIQIFILPGITGKNYEVQTDVAELFPGFVAKVQERLYLDVLEANLRQLADNGIPEKQINVLPLCTYEDNKILYSHRRKDPQRNLNFICWNQYLD